MRSMAEDSELKIQLKTAEVSANQGRKLGIRRLRLLLFVTAPLKPEISSMCECTVPANAEGV